MAMLIHQKLGERNPVPLEAATIRCYFLLPQLYSLVVLLLLQQQPTVVELAYEREGLVGRLNI